MMKIRLTECILLIVCVLALSLFSACGPKGSTNEVVASPGTTTDTGEDPADIPYEITATATSYLITADGESTSSINASVTNVYGTAVPDWTRVTFTILQGDGRVGWYYGPTTDWSYTSNGSASNLYYAGTDEGTVIIKVSTSNNVSTTIELELKKGTIELDSETTELLADGVSETPITANLRGADGEAAPDNTRVDFSITTGSGGLPYSTSSRYNYTTGGTANVTYRASEDAGDVIIQVSAIGYTTSKITIKLSEAVIELSAGESELLANGKASTTITAFVSDTDGNPVPDGTSVSFSILSGGGNLDGYATSRKMSSVAGLASVEYVSGTSAGTATITVSSAGGSSASINITLIKEEVGFITLAVSDPSIPADGVSSTLVTATIKTNTGDAVSKGTEITFSTTLGQFPSGGTVLTTDDSGIISVALQSATSPGTAQISCISGDITQKITAEFEAGGSVSPPATITLSAPASIDVGGASGAVKATIKDSSGQAVAIGTPVTFTTTKGTIVPSGTTQVMDSSGTVTVSLVSGTQAGTATITCVASSVTQMTTVEFTDPSGASTLPPMFISLAANPSTISADGLSSTLLTATLKDATGNPVGAGTSVKFALTNSSSTSRFPDGNRSYTVETLDSSGVISVSLIAGTSPGTEQILVTSGNVSQTIIVEMTGYTGGEPAFLSLSLSQFAVHSDNSDTSTITATVLDAERVPVEGVQVLFSVDGGQISTSSVTTDTQGKAEVIFSSGTTDRSNKTVTIQAEVSGLDIQTVPILITGTTVELEANSSNLEVNCTGPDCVSSTLLTVTVKDFGANPVYLADVNVTSNPSGIVSVSPYIAGGYNSFKTDINGVLVLQVSGVTGGSTDVLVESMGFTASEHFDVGDSGKVFRIKQLIRNPGANQEILPLPGPDEYISLTTTDELQVDVTIPPDPGKTVEVLFATSLGDWKEGAVGDIVYTDLVTFPVGATDSMTATATLTADVLKSAGVATVQVYLKSAPSTRDSISAVFSAPSSEASDIALQGSATVIAPSIGTVSNTLTLSATVKNTGNQVVGNAPVVFSIENPTGGGESISPTVAFTNSSGVASATFTSGSLSTDSSGVTVRAALLDNPTVDDTLPIIIGGTAGSVMIGIGSTVASVNNDTAYELPMSVLVADSNGNPVSGAQVTLNAWPRAYTKGYWVASSAGECIAMYGDPASSLTPFWTANEDEERDLICDGCDTNPTDGCTPSGDDTNGDCELTPPNSAAGNLPGIVTTGDNGVGEFNLTYLKASAIWIQAEITASVRVQGSETQSTYVVQLPVLEGDECNLPHSPYNGTGDPGTGTTVDVGYIDFDSADPTTIALKGTGGGGRSESSLVTFIVYDKDGALLQGATINFELTTTIGGLTIDPIQDVSDSAGKVEVHVNAGNVPTHVRVRAVSDDDPSITQISDTLVVSTGLPDQEHFDLSVEKHTSESWDYNGEIIEVTIGAADRFGNPVPDGTAVYFTAEGGFIQPSCTTTNGTCTVNWSSQAPRPSDGRVTILAHAVGEETFTDLDGDGLFDPAESWVDLTEAYRDDNWNGTYDAGEVFFDFNTSGTFDYVNGLYDGTLCAGDPLDPMSFCSGNLTHVRSQNLVFMCKSWPIVRYFDDATGAELAGPEIDLTSSAEMNVLIFVSDLNDNPMPAGTQITTQCSGDPTCVNNLWEVPDGSWMGQPSNPLTDDDRIYFPFYRVKVENPVLGSGTGTGELTVTVVTPKKVGENTLYSVPIIY